MTHALAAEKLGPCSLGPFFGALRENLNGNETSPVAAGMPLHPTVDDIRSIVARCCSSAQQPTANMVMDALELAGFAGRIIVEKSCGDVQSVELVNGHGFDLKRLVDFDFSFVRPRVACIDGYLDSVHEINRFLEAASASRDPCVVFIRGASDDVKQTLAVNYARGTLRLLPVAVRFDLDGINTLVDIATVTGCDLVSSMKGDSIGSIDFHSLPIVDRITMTGNSVTVQSSRNRAGVARHLNDIIDRRSTAECDKAKLLDARIRSLTARQVIIRLRPGVGFVLNSQAVDRALRSVRSAIEHGVMPDGRLASVDVASRHHAVACATSLRTLGACV